MRQILFPFMWDYSPGVGEEVRRIDTKRVGVVDYIATPGQYNPPGLLYVGDVMVFMDSGTSIITSGGKFFWTLWERPDAEFAERPVRETIWDWLRWPAL